MVTMVEFDGRMTYLRKDHCLALLLVPHFVCSSRVCGDTAILPLLKWWKLVHFRRVVVVCMVVWQISLCPTVVMQVDGARWIHTP